MDNESVPALKSFAADWSESLRTSGLAKAAGANAKKWGASWPAMVILLGGDLIDQQDWKCLVNLKELLDVLG